MSDQANESDRLRVPVKDNPYRRVVFRPKTYDPELIPSLSDCVKLVEKTRVRLRGWDFPFWSPQATSTRFAPCQLLLGELHGEHRVLGIVSERPVRSPCGGAGGHKGKLAGKAPGATIRHLGHWGHLKDFDWDAVPGYIDILNSVYTVTEIFEFALRCQAGVYHGPLAITIELNGVKGYVLTTDFGRSWSEFAPPARITSRKRGRSQATTHFCSADHSMNAVAWLFERFGWLSPNLTPLKSDQKNFCREAVSEQRRPL